MPLRHQSIGCDLKQWFCLHITLSVDGSLNTNTAIVSGPGLPDLIHMCCPCAIPGISVRGWVGHCLCHLCLHTVRAEVMLDRSELFETLTIYLIFFSYTLSRNKGAEKTARAQAGLGICCSNVSKANFS